MALPVISPEQVRNALRTVNDPEIHKDLITLDFVRDIAVHGSDVSFTVTLTTPACPLKDQIRVESEEAVRRLVPGVGKVDIRFDARVRADKRIQESIKLPIKSIVAVGSGKGGVGKSTVSVNLAVALAQSGASVGLLDADIYGPNIPTLMGVNDLPAPDGQTLVPAEAYGVKLMSMGFLIGETDALVWRGPMIHGALRQLLADVAWGELDYLVVDLPLHRGCPAQRGTTGAAYRRSGGHHAAVPVRERRAPGSWRVPEAERAGYRHRGEHERRGIRLRWR